MNNFLLEESKFDPFEIACSKDSLEEKDNILLEQIEKHFAK